MSDAPGGMDEATLAALRDDIAAEISMAVCLDESNDEARDFLTDVMNAVMRHVEPEVRRLSAALAEQQRGLEMTDAELDGTRKRAEAAEAALADLRAKVERLCQSDVVNPEYASVTKARIRRELLAAAPSGEQRKEGQR